MTLLRILKLSLSLPGPSSIAETKQSLKLITKPQIKFGILLEELLRITRRHPIYSLVVRLLWNKNGDPLPLGCSRSMWDGATSGDGNPSSIGVIIRDNRDETITALCMSLNGQYPSLETEVIALEKGVLLAKEMELQQIMLETDALTVVQSLLAGDKEGDLGHLLQGISDTLNSFSCWQIKHLKRNCNRVAHELAQLAKCTSTKQVCKGVSPPTVQHLIQLEKSLMFLAFYTLVL